MTVVPAALPTPVDSLALLNAAGALAIVAATALATLLVDVVFVRDRDLKLRATVAGAVTAAGLAAAIGYLGWQWWMLDATGLHTFYADTAGVFVVDKLVLLMQGLVLALGIGVVLLSIGWEQTRHVGEQLCLIALSLAGLMLLVATKNLLMFFVALETVSICFYVLTAFHKGVRRSAEASIKYFAFGVVSAGFLLFGLAWIIGGTGAVDTDGLARALARGAPSPIVWVGLVFTLVGLGFKIAAAPFHFWAPDAYEGAPTPVAALIATASKVGAFVVTLRLLVVGFGGVAGSSHWSIEDLLHGYATATATAGWVPLVTTVAVVSMVWGNFAAVGQRNVKRLLAYSSVAHAGYILLGVITRTDAGSVAVLYYLFAYGLTNLGAFGVLSALTRAAGGDDAEDLDGMAQRSPLLSLLFMVFLLSLAGVPPLAGFFGKLALFYAVAAAGGPTFGLLGLVAVALVTSAVSLYYYLSVLKHVFVNAPRSTAAIVVPRLWTITLCIVGVAVVALGVWPEPLMALLKDVLSTSASFHS